MAASQSSHLNVEKATSTPISLAIASLMAAFHFKVGWGSRILPGAQKENGSIL